MSSSFAALRTLSVSLAIATASLASGCTGDLGDDDDDGAAAAAGATGTSAGPGGTGSGPGVGVTPGDDAPPFDHPPVDPGSLPQPSGGVRRLSLSQLRASLPILFGMESDGETPITWMMPSGLPGLDAMAGSLGEPDYIEITEENLDPSSMYAKFMDDLARDVCDRALEADVARSSADDRVIVRKLALDATTSSDASGVDENIRYLLVRMHGVQVSTDDDSEVAPWRTVFDAATAEAEDDGLEGDSATLEGWRAVCVGLVVAPEFHLY